MKKYKQCSIRREHWVQTAWIETRGARVGFVVELLPSRDKWEVIEVFNSVVLDEVQLREIRTLNRASLPSVDPMT